MIKYYLVEDEKINAALAQMREEHLKKHKEMWEFTKSIGGASFQVGFAGELLGIYFPEGAPDDTWRKPSNNGMSYPKKRSEWKKKLADVGHFPKLKEYIPDIWENTPHSISYKSGEIEGYSWIAGTIQHVNVSWYSKDSQFAITLPDVKNKIKEILTHYPDAIIDEKCLNWEVPAGLKEILKEEWDLRIAIAQKEQEDD